ncbi:MAG: valine--tRNA ligase [Candidatus Hodarchaeaceae archaeon]|nr:valine--tRNA ligase [Candidatus Hodarchaeaceae archaeon]
MRITKDYNPLEVEPKLQRLWEELGIYRFKREDMKAPIYVIDTPPPYPSGEFHMGTALNWTYFDIVARYKRMRGFNVLFPQGWDCHGLPTEVQVEKRYGIRKGDLPDEKFRELCVKLTEENIAHMREEMNSLGFSIDWSTEYRTMDPSYYSKTQLSFVQLYKKGLIYRGEHPVNWCPRCETAIADAEVEYEDRETTLSYIKFKLADESGFLTIATTRPEYLPACVVVAVYPGDKRYAKYIGKKLEVPPFGQVVEIIEDHEVDPEFGTGVVMVCTFGDKTDVRWVKRHKLPVVKLIDEKGNMTEAAGKYAGMTLEECKRAIIEDLKKVGLIEKQEKLAQSVGSCWRCKTPVEILTKPQWFMRVLDLKDKVVEGAKKVRWVPEHMRLRLIDWVESMDWDWVISRQRIFATPIPVWYCAKCKEPIVADEKQIPVIPAKDKPSVERCPVCGGEKFEPEQDVLDTWMDSSITIAAHAGWPDLDRRLFPADLQPNGTDIIRTWDYYLLVRHLALLGEVPYRTVLINGMVFGEDGRKMSKSLGNYVDTTMARKKYGTDALRQWAAIGASTGSDIPFSWKDVEFGHRFMRKFWNAARFAGPHLDAKVAKLDPKKLKFRPIDCWILSRLNRLVKQVTTWLEDFQFNRALGEVQTFLWHEFCDMYIEEVKHRLYGGDPTANAAKFTLYHVILSTTKLLAPFVPHFTEEVYQTYFARDYQYPSVHVSSWPETNEKLVDESAEQLGRLTNAVVSALRQFKSERGMALSQELPKVEIYSPNKELAKQLKKVKEDIAGTMRVKEMKVTGRKPKLIERVLRVEPNLAKLGPRFRGEAELVMAALREARPEELARQLVKGKIVVQKAGKQFELVPDEVRVVKETESAGHKVGVIDIPEPALTIIVTL